MHTFDFLCDEFAETLWGSSVDPVYLHCALVHKECQPSFLG